MKIYKGDIFSASDFYCLGADKSSGFALAASQAANEKIRDYDFMNWILLKEAVSLLKHKNKHDEDCADQHETFDNEYEECECGASSVIGFLEKVRKFNE